MDFQVPRMDERESRAWLALVGVMQRMPASLDAQLQARSHLTHYEFTVLSTLSQAPQRTARMKRLAAVTNATMPRISKVVTRLEQRGFVERHTGDDGDGRAVSVRITAAGRRALLAAIPPHIAYVRELVIDTLTPAQLDQLADILEPLMQRLDPMQTCTVPASS